MHIVFILALVTAFSFAAWLIPVKPEMVFVTNDFEAEFERINDIADEIRRDDSFSLYEAGNVNATEYAQLVKPSIQQTNDLIHYLVSLDPPPEYKKKYVETFDMLRNYKSYLLDSIDYASLPDGEIREQRYQLMTEHKKIGMN